MPSLKKKTKKVTLKKKVILKKTKKKQRHSTIGHKSINIVKIDNPEETRSYRLKSPTRIIPKVWELPNRKTFFNWVDKTFRKYKSAPKESKQIFQKLITKTSRTTKKSEFYTIQKLVRDFMQDSSPQRGILLYHGLGSGKTCGSIAIAEALLSKKEVIVLSKAALENNYISNIKKCGSDYMKNNNHWVFTKCQTEEEKKLCQELGIPTSIINKNGGAYLVDYSKQGSNYESLGYHQSDLDDQIEATIRNRFKFKHIDDTRLLSKLSENPFDNKVIIVDEVHNLTNRMASGTKTGIVFEKLLMEAKDCKLIFLSGTPLINNVFEATKLFNILRGYIVSFVFRVISDYVETIKWPAIKSAIIKNKYVDQIIINKNGKTIKVSMNPSNFITSPNKNGIIYQPGDIVTEEQFSKMIKKAIGTTGYRTSARREVDTCLPIKEKNFELTFYNPRTNRLKKREVIKKRIVGLTSYYATGDRSKFPELLPINIVGVRMSDYQFDKYQSIRNTEIEKEKKRRGGKGSKDQMQSSYRMASRVHCTFVFPEDVGSPYDKENLALLEIMDAEGILLDDKEAMENLLQAKKFDDMLKRTFLKILSRDKEKYLSIENDSLAKHSPKYKLIIENIMNSVGTSLVYSQFITLVGLNTLALALEATGKFAKFDIKSEGGQWVLKENPGDENKMKYVMYSGVTNNKKKDIFRLIYNSEFESLPSNCNKLKQQLHKRYGDDQNLHGNIIKIFMTTQTGAEGLDLKCVRQVHIMEPYWQPVLLEQVIGRAVRNESHIRLPVKEQNVKVFIYMAQLTDNQIMNITGSNLRRDVAKYNNGLNKKNKIVTSDEALYIISMRKKEIIKDFQVLMRETAFDCSLNTYDNYDPDNPITCLDYNSNDREEYISTPSIDDTMDIIDTQQEYDVVVDYVTFTYKGKKFYIEAKPAPGSRRYIYDETFIKGGRFKPVGEIKEMDGKLIPLFYKKKVKKIKKIKKRKSNKESQK